MSKTVHRTSTLVYYDGPILFEGRDNYGGHYIGMADNSKDSDKFIIVGVEPDRLRNFRGGSLDLFGLITEKDEDTTWFIGNMRDDDADIFDLEEQDIPIAESDCLPERGFFLHHSDAQSKVIEEARVHNRMVLEVSVDPPETSLRHEISAATLSGILHHIQTVVKYAYNRAIRNLPPAQKAQLGPKDAYNLDVLIPAAAGSFKIIMGAAKESKDLLGDPEITRGLVIVDKLF